MKQKTDIERRNAQIIIIKCSRSREERMWGTAKKKTITHRNGTIEFRSSFIFHLPQKVSSSRWIMITRSHTPMQDNLYAKQHSSTQFTPITKWKLVVHKSFKNCKCVLDRNRRTHTYWKFPKHIDRWMSEVWKLFIE